MNPAEFWKNFRLGEELGISGAFTYNGLRRFYELRNLDQPDEVFEVIYNLAVGIERLLKIAVVLLEHAEDVDQEDLEKSLITHNHLDLLHRVRRHVPINVAGPHNEFLKLLATFYKSHRYDRFSISSITDPQKERDALCRYFSKQLGLELPKPGSLIGTPNDARYKKLLQKVVQTICRELYRIIWSRADELNLYTYELRRGSKAETIFLGEADTPAENVLWKELLLFFMNTKTTSGYLKFLRGIPALDFDPALVGDYLDCFQSDAAKALVVNELEHLHEELEGKGERFHMIEVIGSPDVYFDDEDEDEWLR
ncbi:hypothetical protein SAMN05216526_0783 [Ectothiorhodosinus mongolicus]|uniref:Uncharacterized protein n=1 Tax=Ectothiorhodosinus mongolicus TaxID=233100 RepID=A0A1R3VTW1_9GAMM|nr:hypothetical protein [Ectothiorhodosinus mongolicus]ULX56762.1 hypothetical protein CKX93_02970 [Ectothiorhodosinus mongolicus]SIT67167.1 hypothetical protein SAMN05216526_0783 [Ectothiorhodosinus mongolicus]